MVSSDRCGADPDDKGLRCQEVVKYGHRDDGRQVFGRIIVRPAEQHFQVGVKVVGQVSALRQAQGCIGSYRRVDPRADRGSLSLRTARGIWSEESKSISYPGDP